MDSSGNKHRPWKVVGVIAWILIIAFVGIRMFGASQISPTVRKDVAKLYATKVSLPGDWHKPAVLPPPDVLAFHKKLPTQMEAIRKKHELLLFGTGTSNPGVLGKWPDTGLTDEERSSYPLLLADLQPVIDETSRSVRLAGYTFATDFNLNDMTNFLAVHTFAKLTFVVAREQALNGQCIEAMETEALSLRMLSRPEQSSLMTHLISVAVTALSANYFSNLADSCGTNTLALRRGLELLNELRPEVFPGEIKHWFHEKLVSLRFAAAYGYPVDISPQSQATIVLQSYQLWGKDYYQWLINNLPSNDPKVAVAEERLEGIKMRLNNKPFFELAQPNDLSPFMRGVVTMATGVDPVLAYHVETLPYYPEAFTRSYTARAMYDLTRMKYARRLMEANPAATTVTAYLHTIPEDPFTSAPFLLSPAQGMDYSVGPDVTDDKAAIVYDATNGTLSVGDIWMKGR